MKQEDYNAQIQQLDQELIELFKKRLELVTRCKTCFSGILDSQMDGFQMVDQLKKDNIKVVFQGVEGAYSHQAMRQYFGKDVDAFSVPTFEMAAAAIAEGRADYAVLPIENTTGGAVGDVLDLQMKYDFYTVGEWNLPIQHVLLGLPGTRVEDIDTVYSHPQAIAQCIDYLETHPDWARVPMSNTAASALKVVEEGMKNHAVIASELCGELYHLDILARGIATNKHNTTRFIIATGKKVFCKDAGKVSLCFECSHSEGTLFRLLSNFAFNHLNMTKIESRPAPGRNFEYRFFIEFDGNLQDPAVQNAIWGIRKEATVCRVLGNFR